MNYLKEYVKLYDGSEIPGLYAVWCGLFSISATMGRRVWIDMKAFKIFPNLFVLLVAGSGRCKKSTAIGIAEDVLRMVEPKLNILPNRTSASAVIRDIKSVNVTDENEFLSETCEGIAMADEFNTFLNPDVYSQISSTLISFYDCKSVYEYSTRERGIERLENTCLDLIGGTTMTYIKDCIPVKAIGDGLASRMNFVFVPSPTGPKPFVESIDQRDKIFTDCVLYLQSLLTVDGPMIMDERASKLYSDTYIDFYNNSPLHFLDATMGYASRRGNHLLKLAMLFSLSEGTNRVIKVQHVEKALRLLEMTESYLPMLMNIIQANETGLLLETVYNTIKQQKTASRKDLLEVISNRIDSKRLTDLLETLIQAGRIKAYAHGNKIYYEVSA